MPVNYRFLRFHWMYMQERLIISLIFIDSSSKIWILVHKFKCLSAFRSQNWRISNNLFCIKIYKCKMDVTFWPWKIGQLQTRKNSCNPYATDVGMKNFYKVNLMYMKRMRIKARIKWKNRTTIFRVLPLPKIVCTAVEMSLW